MIIDPGHGGKDSGAAYKNIYEKDIALAYAKDFADIAASHGKITRLTRDSDVFVDLGKRAAIVTKGEIFISCHVNAASNAAANGLSVWYHGNADSSHDLAECIFNRIYAANLFKRYGAGVLSDFTRYSTGFQVLRDAEKHQCRAAVLIEPGFLSNTKDRAVLTNPAKRHILAQAIYDGLEAYLNLK